MCAEVTLFSAISLLIPISLQWLGQDRLQVIPLSLSLLSVTVNKLCGEKGFLITIFLGGFFFSPQAQ